MNPYQAVWELTLRCNMNCLHCGSLAGKARSNELTTDQAKKVVNQLNNIGTESVVLMGGEFFLRKDWFEIAKEVNKTDIDLIMISNGYCITKDIIDKLKKLRISNFGISIDGGTSTTHDSIRKRKGSFIRCFRFLEVLNKNEIPTTVVTSVLKNNFGELEKLRNLLIGKVWYWQLQVGCPVGRLKNKMLLTKKQFYELGEFIDASIKDQQINYQVMGADNCGYFSGKFYNTDWLGCQAGKRVLGIRSNGDILSCLSINDNRYIEGNVLDIPLDRLWYKKRFAQFNKQIKFGPNCSLCFHKKSCGGGCSSMSIAITGFPHNNPYCYHLIEK